MIHERPVVFVVDDDQAVRASLKFALELEGLNVQVCKGGAELLAHRRLSDAVCLVIDFKMPLMDGFELVADLHERGVCTPVILITGEVTNRLRRRAQAAGVRHVVEKPLLDGVLLETLHALLQSPH
jgi:FixJ family two-component response regulator